MKTLFFIGTSREDLAEFPRDARRRAGHELHLLQTGREPSDFKPLSSIGPGVCEVRVRDRSGTFRVIYLAKQEAAIYVLHAFQKKTRATSRRDLEIAARRYRSLGVRS